MFRQPAPSNPNQPQFSGPYSGYYQRAGQALQQHLGPYEEAGTRALPQLEEQYGQLMTDPGAMVRRFGAGYEASPGYQFEVGEATRAANQAAAAGGMVGSGAEQQALAQRIAGIAGKDYNTYLGQVLGMYGQGLGGEREMAGRGMGAAGDVGTSLANMQMSQMQMQRARDEAERERKRSLWGAALGGVSHMLF
jgi:hypothetical protein